MKGVEDYFKGLADINRLRIINLLLQGELCGCDIQYVVGSSQSNVSRHLTYLKRSGLVVDRREGYRVYYRLIQDNKPECRELLAYLKVALTDKVFIADSKTLKQAIKDGDCTISESRTRATPRRRLSAPHA
ncbi:MAG TPA: metalloregulator ArsR/SmtB family transcription factor [Candidatus Angelobacter sp.]|nr:metalloregulator ArsR/SmtB family transcription factor [Candidatus Angelobacter sp.]